ncbi:MAG: type II toxin-antitoxin system RnlB family antitoxin [Silvanigrellaceae bacterium]|nr:type II toxin-antitoxin system RnlB family antitoxin [Silvanigrellaceae bacterium]
MGFSLIQTQGRFKAVVLSNGYDRLVECFDEIEDKLVNSNTSKGLILLDMLSCNGNEKNRFMEIFFDGKKLKDSTIKIALNTNYSIKNIDNNAIMHC